MPGTAHTQITRRSLVNADVRTRLTFFASQFLDAWWTLQPPVLTQMGERDTTSALEYKVPIPIGEATWNRFIDGIRYGRNSELIGRILVADWASGATEQVKKLQSDEWAAHGWGRKPERIARTGILTPEKLLVTLIEAGETTASIENNLDGDQSSSAIKIFGQGKPVDPMGQSSAVYSNLFTSTGTSALGNTDKAAPLTLANIDRVAQHIETVLAQNGEDYRELEWRYVLVHKQDKLKAKRYFEDQGDENKMINEPFGDTEKAAATGGNVYPMPNTARKYGVKVISSPYLTTTGVWYPICMSPEMELAPWITLQQIPANPVPLGGNFPEPPQGGGDPLRAGVEWMIDDLASHFYRHGIPGVIPPGNVAIAAKTSWGVGITEPWRIFKCKPS